MLKNNLLFKYVGLINVITYRSKMNYFTFIEMYSRQAFILRTKIYIITLFFLPVAQLVQNSSILVVLNFKTR